MYDTWVKTWCIAAAAIFQSKIQGDPKSRISALKTPPMKASHVLHFDLCATHGICDQPFHWKISCQWQNFKIFRLILQFFTKCYTFLESSHQELTFDIGFRTSQGTLFLFSWKISCQSQNLKIFKQNSQFFTKCHTFLESSHQGLSFDICYRTSLKIQLQCCTL